MIKVTGSPRIGKVSLTYADKVQPVYLASTKSTTVATSTDGVSWTTHVVDRVINRVASNGRFFLTATYSSGTLYLYKSSDGVSWYTIAHNIPYAADADITYNKGYFFLVLRSTTMRVYYSADGANWVAQAVGTIDGTGARTAPANQRFGIVTIGGGQYSMYGTLGSSAWASVAPTTTGFGTTYYGVYGIGWFNNKLILCGQGAKISTNEGATSSWVLRRGAATNDMLYAFCPGADGVSGSSQNFALAAGATASSVALAYKSTDGITWTNVSGGWSNSSTGFGSSTVRDIIYDGSIFIGISSTGIIATTTDGSTVTKRYQITGVSNVSTSIAYKMYA